MKSFYLFFAVNEYANGWPLLKDPVGDLSFLARVLEMQYGFQKLDFLKNQAATSGAVFQWIDRLATQNVLDEDTQLFIYFSCYKHSRSSTDQQYWVAHNGEPPWKKIPEKYGLIEAEDIIGAFSNIPCRHILLASDACFSERLIPQLKGSCQRIKGMPSPLGEDWVLTAREKMSREIITSSVNVGEFGYSPFSKELAEVLSDNIEPVLSAEDLIPELKKQGGLRSLPEYGILRHGHQYGGSFLFDILKDAAPKKSLEDNVSKRELFWARCKTICVSILLLVPLFLTLRFFTTGSVPNVEVDFFGLTGTAGYLAVLSFLGWVLMISGLFIRRAQWLQRVSPFKCGFGFAISCAVISWLSFIHPNSAMKWLDGGSVLFYLTISPFIGGLLQFGADAKTFRFSTFLDNKRLFSVIFFTAVTFGALLVRGSIKLVVEQIISVETCMTVSTIMPVLFIVATLGTSWFFASKEIDNTSLWAVILLQCAYWGAQIGISIDSNVMFHFFIVLTVMCGIAGLGSAIGTALLSRQRVK